MYQRGLLYSERLPSHFSEEVTTELRCEVRARCVHVGGCVFGVGIFSGRDSMRRGHVLKGLFKEQRGGRCKGERKVL